MERMTKPVILSVSFSALPRPSHTASTAWVAMIAAQLILTTSKTKGFAMTTSISLSNLFSRLMAPLACAAALMVTLPAQALQIMPYSAAALASAEKAGQSYALHFHATWCPTCRAQEKVLQNLQSDAELDKVSVLVVDFDTERDLKLARKVRAQSTLIVYHGTAEKARLAGDTDPANIKAALKAGLQ